MSNTSLLGSLFGRASRGPSQKEKHPPQKVSNAHNQPKSYTISETHWDAPDDRAEAPPTAETAPVDIAQSDAPAPASDTSSEPDIGEAVDLVRQIRTILAPQGDFISIPADAVLKHLPQELRGPSWPGDTATGVDLMLDKETLLEKLRGGRIAYHLGEFLPDLQDGWVADNPAAEVLLDLPTVVKAIPPELFGEDPGRTTAVDSGGRDYFAPATSAADATTADADRPHRTTPAENSPPVARPLPFTNTTGPKRQVVPTHIPGAWNGVEKPCRASVGAVDVNTATMQELQTLPGIGPDRARMILNNRRKHGPFDGIYDLLRIRGIGRKRFCRITGLSLRRRDRHDRHEVLNKLINLEPDARPSLNEIMQKMGAVLPDTICTLVAHDGAVLASSSRAEEATALRAAVVPMLFRRTGRYLQDLAPGASDCVTMPMADPPMLLFAVGDFFLMLETAAADQFTRITTLAVPITTELKWLLGPRAMVGEPTAETPRVAPAPAQDTVATPASPPIPAPPAPRRELSPEPTPQVTDVEWID